MSALNPNNANGGGTGSSAMSQIVTDAVSVSSPDHTPDTPILGGPTFLSGSPAGREAKPTHVIDGGNPILSQ